MFVCALQNIGLDPNNGLPNLIQSMESQGSMGGGGGAGGRTPILTEILYKHPLNPPFDSECSSKHSLFQIPGSSSESLYHEMHYRHSLASPSELIKQAETYSKYKAVKHELRVKSLW